MIRRHAPGYNFAGDLESGVTFRWGATPALDPAFAPWPELADISISNRCSKGCDFCYRDSVPAGGLMSLEEYDFVLYQLQSPRWGSVFQVALGGGEPLEHPHLLEFLRLTRTRGVIPNFTTNGELLDRSLVTALAGLAGAVAISIPRLEALDPRKVALLAGAGLRANLHYVLERRNLEEATAIVEGRFDGLLADVNAVIFLTYKPRGRGTADRCLREGPELDRFLVAIDARRSGVRIGFDACFVPLLLRSTRIDPSLVDACECGFFSVYVDEQLQVKPCSFACGDAQTFSLRELPFSEIWERLLAPFREAQAADLCGRSCANRGHCRGRCPYFSELAFCHTGASND
jgi:radical SAM protein with 4Fe4S-binding SPASM domain